MSINMCSFEYGEQLPDGIGFYNHPKGGSCALTIGAVAYLANGEDAGPALREILKDENIHQVTIHGTL